MVVRGAREGALVSANLIEVDVKMHVKNWSDQKKDHFGPKKDQKGPKMRFLNFELEEKLDHHF